ncbi:glycosyltransferase family 4 protein [Paenibacillus sp. USDA918EY]|uniref:glycosyltransferase family 4 protein n=1 Tax=Paenibacillus sp. USDA918EY TaxID=2689575 RepID=UPI001F1854DB|nr:glycosyltransferase family 4 protein [Paenibacillus sp. USDA918EY]
MNHVSICGGVKIIFEQANRLTLLGYQITIASWFPRPEWFPLNATYIQLPAGSSLGDAIPKCDLIVATYYTHIYDCIRTGIAPVVYFEQGDFHLFDNNRMSTDDLHYVRKQISFADAVYTVSEQTAKSLKQHYSCEAKVIHNGLDSSRFNVEVPKYEWPNPYMLMMGDVNTTFKGVSDIWEAYQMLRLNHHRVDLIWITPTEPAEEIRNIPWISKIVVNPSQSEIASLYRGALFFVSGSHYESFSLPVMEAMMCGCPVITTNNLGVLEYAKHRENALLAEIKDPGSLFDQMVDLINDIQLREQLVKNGLETSSAFTWEVIIPKIEAYYSTLAEHELEAINTLDDWDIFVTQDSFEHMDDFFRFISRLLQSQRDEVQLPVIYEVFENHRIGRWETAARRKGSDKDRLPVDRALYFVRTSNKIEGTYGEAIYGLQTGLYEQSFRIFSELLDEASEDMRPTYIRWLILCLLEQEKDHEALQLIGKTLQVYSDHADFYYLYIVASTLLGRGDLDDIVGITKILGDAVHYPEFFIGTALLAEKQVKASLQTITTF